MVIPGIGPSTGARAARPLGLLLILAVLALLLGACGRTVTEEYVAATTTSATGTTTVNPGGGGRGGAGGTTGEGGSAQGGHGGQGTGGQGGAGAGLPDGGAVLVGIEVSPPLITAAVGTQAVLAATAMYSDGSSADVTPIAAWDTSAPAVATVSGGLVSAVGPGVATITAAFQGLAASSQVTVPAAPVVSIAITPGSATTGLGGAVQFTAVATLADQTHQDVTATAAWTSTDPAIASVSAGGLAIGLTAGAVTIRAEAGGVLGEATLAVNAAALVSIAVTPTDPSVAPGASLAFTAMGTYADASVADLTATATWSSSDPAVVDVAKGGKAAAVAPGVAVVTATVGNLAGSSTVTVKPSPLVAIAVTPASSTIGVGGTVALVATGTYADSTTADLTADAAWASSAPLVASASNAPGAHGVVTALSAGPATITATLAGVAGKASITVTAAPLVKVVVTPQTASAPKGTTIAFKATGTYADNTSADVTVSATWSASDPTVATLSNAAGSNGVASAVAVGTTAVTATIAGLAGSASLTVTSGALKSIAVTPASPSLTIGLKQAMTATGTYDDGSLVDLTKQAVWTTADPGVATVSNAAGAQGLLAAVGAGQTTVKATFSGVSGAATVTVASPTLVQISVSPIAPSVAVGVNVPFAAMAIFSNNTSQNVTQQATWSSSTLAVAKLGQQPGVVQTLSAGTTTIAAKWQNKTGSQPLTVTEAILVSLSVTPIDPSLAVGTTQPFQAMAIYNDGTSQNVTLGATWTSSAPAVAGVANQGQQKGRVTTLAEGKATITATWKGVSGTSDVTVTGAVLVGVSVSPAVVTVTVGTYQPFSAQAIYSDNTSKDVTGQATWTSSDDAVAGVSSQGNTKGLAKAVAAGTASIQAAYGGLTGSATMKVTAAAVVSIQLSPVDPTVALGVPQKLFATAILADNTSQDVTAQATWTSSDGSVAAVSDAIGSKGLAQTLAVGKATIAASFGGVTGTTTLTVAAVKLLEIQVTPFAPTLPVGFATPFQATGLYSDSSVQDLTGLVTWISSAPALAAVSSAPGSKGLVTPLAPGAVTISASYLGVTGKDSVTVSSAKLASLAVSPAKASIAVGASLQLVATGTFSDQTTLDLTTYVTWLTDAPAVVAVSNAKGSQGLAKALSKGSANVTATKNGVSGLAALTAP